MPKDYRPKGLVLFVFDGSAMVVLVA